MDDDAADDAVEVAAILVPREDQVPVVPQELVRVGRLAGGDDVRANLVGRVEGLDRLKARNVEDVGEVGAREAIVEAIDRVGSQRSIPVLNCPRGPAS